jgi:hypothetical protein
VTARGQDFLWGGWSAVAGLIAVGPIWFSRYFSIGLTPHASLSGR